MKGTDVLGCTAWAVFFALASAVIPVFGLLITLLSPLPFLYYSTKLGLFQGAKVAGLAVLTVGLIGQILGFPYFFLFSLEFALLGLFLSEVYRRRMSFGYTLLLGTSFMVGIGLAMLFFTAVNKGMGPFEILLAYFRSSLNETISTYKGMDLSPEKAVKLEEYGKVLMSTVSKIYPAAMVIATGAVVWLNILASRRILTMKGLEYPDFDPIDRWRAPDKLVWGIIGTGFCFFFFPGGIRLLAINTLIVLMAIYLLHGLSILFFFLNKYKVPFFVRVLIFFLIALHQLFLAAIALAGLFDQWIDFRKLQRSES